MLPRRGYGLSGPCEDCSEPPERRTVPEGLSWRPMGVYSRVLESQQTNSGLVIFLNKTTKETDDVK